MYILNSTFRILLQREREQKRKVEYEEMMLKRQQYKEKTKNALVFGEMPSEKKASKGGGRGRKGAKDGDILSDSGSDVDRPGSPSEKR